MSTEETSLLENPEISPEAIDELINKSPLTFTSADEDAIVMRLRDARKRWEETQANKKSRTAGGIKKPARKTKLEKTLAAMSDDKRAEMESAMENLTFDDL